MRNTPRELDNEPVPGTPDGQKSAETLDAEIVQEARDRIELVASFESEFRREALEDFRFLAGEQWPDDIRQQRVQDGRPVLTINRLPQFVNLIVNEQRNNPPSIKVSPVDSRADVEVAEVLQGMIRHVEYRSDAEVAYTHGARLAAICGLGYARILTDFESPMSFDQDILIERIENPLCGYMDPGIVRPDGSDANYFILVTRLDREDYKRQYPGSRLASMTEWGSSGADFWIDKDTVLVAEYYRKVWRTERLCQLLDGTVKLESELGQDPTQPDAAIVHSRETQVPLIEWFKINGTEILDREIWPGKYIPILRFVGDEIWVDGRRVLSGIVRHARDPQRMVNYWAASEAEQIALSSKAPWIGAEGQFEGHEEQWESANRRNAPYLEYKPVSIAGQPAPPPQRNTAEPPVMAITNARRQAEDSLKAVTGTYDAALGALANDTSGIAMARRNAQTQLATLQYRNNTERTIRFAGRQLLDLFPKIFTRPRVMRTIGTDGTEKMVAINQLFDKNGKPKQYFLNVGMYDAVVSSGPTYTTKRQEAAASMLQVLQAWPQFMQIAGDLVVKNQDWPDAQEFAARVRSILPPQVQAMLMSDGSLPPEIAAKLQQSSVLVEQLTSRVNELTDRLQARAAELDTKERVALIQAQATIMQALAKIEADDARHLLKVQVDSIQDRIALLNKQEPSVGDEKVNPGPVNTMPMPELKLPQQQAAPALSVLAAQ